MGVTTQNRYKMYNNSVITFLFALLLVGCFSTKKDYFVSSVNDCKGNTLKDIGFKKFEMFDTLLIKCDSLSIFPHSEKLPILGYELNFQCFNTFATFCYEAYDSPYSGNNYNLQFDISVCSDFSNEFKIKMLNEIKKEASKLTYIEKDTIWKYFYHEAGVIRSSSGKELFWLLDRKMGTHILTILTEKYLYVFKPSLNDSLPTSIYSNYFSVYNRYGESGFFNTSVSF